MGKFRKLIGVYFSKVLRIVADFNVHKVFYIALRTFYRRKIKTQNIKTILNRKIYNGMLKTYLYQFMGPKPPKKPVVKKEEA